MIGDWGQPMNPEILFRDRVVAAVHEGVNIPYPTHEVRIATQGNHVEMEWIWNSALDQIIHEGRE